MSRKRAAELTPIAELYNTSLEQHGPDAKGVGWGDPASHELRFEKLASVIVRDVTEITVADLGCGYGALLPYLTRVGVDVGAYRGYEISEPMLAEARRRNQVSEATFQLGSAVDTEAEYVFASGIFNVRLENDEGSWRDYILQTLDNMDSHASRGWAFNLLTTYVDFEEPHLYYGDPMFFFDHCKKRFSRKVSLLHDYPLYEWTMIVRK